MTMKNYRIEDWIKIYMEFWTTFNDTLRIIIIEALDGFKYESDKMFESVVEEILNAIRDEWCDPSDEWITKYAKEYVDKNYPYN